MKIVALLLAVVAAACSVEQPHNAEVESPYSRDDLYQATEVIRLEWCDRTGNCAIDLPEIRWFEGKCLEYADIEGECLQGRTQYTPFVTEMHLLVEDSIHETALAHELLHVALERDPGHDSAYWSEVKDVRAVMAAVGY